MKIVSHSEERREILAEYINHLIAICKDGEAGYRSAAGETNDPELQQTFTRLARQRRIFVSELQGAVDQLDCEPADSSSLTGAMHRGWIKIKTFLSSNDARSALAECERGEDAAVAAYRKVLDEAPLNSELRALVGTEAVAVKDAHDEIRFLRDHPAYSHGG